MKGGPVAEAGPGGAVRTRGVDAGQAFEAFAVRGLRVSPDQIMMKRLGQQVLT